jgi:hypothetical protein
MRRVVLSLAALIVAGPAQALDPRIVVLTQDSGVYADRLNPHWNPTPDQAEEALTGLVVFLEQLDTQPIIDDDLRRRGAVVRRKLADYRFQAYGVTAPTGNTMPLLSGEKAKLVILNGACTSSHAADSPNWSRSPMLVFDGGDCYLRVYYDIEKRRMAWLSINGN